MKTFHSLRVSSNQNTSIRNYHHQDNQEYERQRNSRLTAQMYKFITTILLVHIRELLTEASSKLEQCVFFPCFITCYLHDTCQIDSIRLTKTIFILKEMHKMNLNEFVRKLSTCVFLRNAKVKSLSIVIGNLQIWHLKFFTVLICEVVYSCNHNMMSIVEQTAKRSRVVKAPSLVSQKERRATSRSPSIPALMAKHCCVQATKGALACTTSSSITSPILR